MSAYLNGKFLPLESCSVSVLDRGFLFGDGVYELIPCFGGKPFRLGEHLQRLKNSLSAVRITNPCSDEEWSGIFHELLKRLEEEYHSSNAGHTPDFDQTIYLQVTRGVAPRDHAFPPRVQPTVFAMAHPLKPPAAEILEAGVSAISMADIRWHRCDIKSIALLPNILSRQQAIDEGAAEAILIRDGFATEGAASNLFIVSQGTVITPPKSSDLLPGVTRDLVLELIIEHGFPYEETKIKESMLNDADEIWLTSSSKDILPVTQLNNRSVGNGKPGPVWQRAYQLIIDYKVSLRKSSK